MRVLPFLLLSSLVLATACTAAPVGPVTSRVSSGGGVVTRSPGGRWQDEPSAPYQSENSLPPGAANP